MHPKTTILILKTDARRDIMGSRIMKKHFKLLWGFVTVVMIAFAFAACNFVLKNDPNNNGGNNNGGNNNGGNNGGQNTGYSIVGIWKYSETDPETGTTYTIIYSLYDNNEGLYTYSEGQNTYLYDLAYNFDSNTNQGTVAMTGRGGGGTMVQTFRVEWLGANNIVISILGKDDYGHEVWEVVGVFTRQV